MIRIVESLNDKEGKLVIGVRDSEGELKNLIEYIKDVAQTGHTFDVVVDPGNDDWEKSFEIDGDGAFRIDDVEFETDDDDEDVDEIEIKEEALVKSNDVIEALEDMCDAMEHLSNIWDKDNNRDCLDNGDYPFDKSFNELVTDVMIWARQCKMIRLNGDEE